MPGPSLKLTGALFAGTLAGVAAFTTFTSSGSSAQLSPAGDNTAVTTPAAAESTAPCPAGTVERGDSCVKTVTVHVAQPADDGTEPSEAPEPDAQTGQQPAAPAAAPADAPQPQATGRDSEHADDASEVEPDAEHSDSEHADQESDG